MSVSTINHQGEPVLISASFDQGTDLFIWGRDMQMRILLPWERLIIDVLFCDSASTPIQLIDDGPNGATTFATFSGVAPFGLVVANGPWVFDGGPSGFLCSPGHTPRISTDAGGWIITGAGRVVAATPVGPMPWQARLA
jgi:hypothetical protein